MDLICDLGIRALGGSRKTFGGIDADVRRAQGAGTLEDIFGCHGCDQSGVCRIAGPTRIVEEDDRHLPVSVVGGQLASSERIGKRLVVSDSSGRK